MCAKISNPHVVYIMFLNRIDSDKNKKLELLKLIEPKKLEKQEKQVH